MKLRVWWIPQIPMTPFHITVFTFKEAKFALKILADYDIFQLRNGVKPSYLNDGGLEVSFNPGVWREWEDADGLDIDALSPQQIRKLDEDREKRRTA